MPECGVDTVTTVRTRRAKGSASMPSPSEAPGLTSSRASSPPVEWPMRWMGPSSSFALASMAL